MKRVTSKILAFLLALLCCGILIFVIETNKSFIQIILAFIILFPPVSFISSISNKVAVFLFSSVLVLGSYICIKYHWFDTVYGVILAIILGTATYLFRVSKAKTFDSGEKDT